VLLLINALRKRRFGIQIDERACYAADSRCVRANGSRGSGRTFLLALGDARWRRRCAVGVELRRAKAAQARRRTADRPSF